MKIQKAPDDLPSRFIYELIERCNYNCLHCFVPHRLNGPSTSKAIEIANKVADSGVPSISWTGGEPYLRKDLFDIMRNLKSSSVVHTINTNGSLINEDVAKRTNDFFKLARVSIYGSSDTFFRNTGNVKRYDYETSFRAIEFFLETGLPVQVNFPIISPNLGDIEPVSRDINRRFGTSVEEVVYIPSIKIGEKKFASEFYPSLEKIVLCVSKFAPEMKFPIRYFIWRPGKHMLLKADTNVYAHPIFDKGDGTLKIGNIFEESIQSLWSKFPLEFRQSHRELTPSVDYLI